MDQGPKRTTVFVPPLMSRPMSDPQLDSLFASNRAWANAMTSSSPTFFSDLAAGQRPRYLWIGCADSRVPANEIVGLPPGAVFVHRNVANLVVDGDVNCLSVIQYAVDVLGVEHVIVTGHYGCGGIEAALNGSPPGPVYQWLAHVRQVAFDHSVELRGYDEPGAMADRLCELNVARQVEHVCRTEIVQRAWDRGQSLHVHGWIYRLRDGLLHDLGVSQYGP
jgi:carbonic anhydrase